jgi:hypothetical protein
VVRFLKMGLGIEHRARRLAPFWAEHLSRTRAAQARWAQQASGEWLSVLGAGRLLDLNRADLPPRFKGIRLVDADPLCAAYWRDLPKLADAVCADVSGCLNEWAVALQNLRTDWTGTLSGIRGFGASAERAYSTQTDALLSLNILSQLQIVWQDAVEAFLVERFGRRIVDAREEDWLDALRPGGRMLVEQHLAAMECSNAQFVLLITDVEYLEYRGRVFRQDRWGPPPVEWTREGGWRVEDGVTCEVSPALEGVELDESGLGQWLPSYHLEWQDWWLWHIAPLGTEKQEWGKVHRVGAFALRRVR